MSKKEPPALLDWDSGGNGSDDQLGDTAEQHHTRIPDLTDVGNIVYRLRLYAGASEMIAIHAADAEGIADMLQHLSARVDELEKTQVELQPDPVLVEGSWIPVAEWPEILGNFMRLAAEYGRDAKEASLRILDLKAGREIEQTMLRNAAQRIEELEAQLRGADG
ncbi:MAG: hypothetical protein FWF90_16185 [Promicromonosporaceae bacterium]|nr:hypothetical protein [Promicromonosporaceae bacterium]